MNNTEELEQAIEAWEDQVADRDDEDLLDDNELIRDTMDS